MGINIIDHHGNIKLYLSRRNLRYSEQSCWEPALNQGGREASKKFLGAYAALCRNPMQNTHGVLVFLKNNILLYCVLQQVILTCVCARKAKSSCSFFIRELEPFRCRDKTWRLKLEKELQCLKGYRCSSWTDAVDTQLTLWPWTASGLWNSWSKCFPGWSSRSSPSQTSRFASKNPNQMSCSGRSTHSGLIPTWSSLLWVLEDPNTKISLVHEQALCIFNNSDVYSELSF